jgi:hypothetical protein
MQLSKLVCVGSLLLVSPAVPSAFAMNPGVVAINHTYEARIRLNGKVSTTQVQASDAGHAKKLVQAQFGVRPAGLEPAGCFPASRSLRASLRHWTANSNTPGRT